jgi:hypothetical protein
MIVAALIDAGADIDALRGHLASLSLGEVRIDASRVRRQHLAGTLFEVTPPGGEQPHRHLADILAVIDAADLPGRSGELATRIFTRLGQAEAAVHDIDIQKVHFHEVGAVDSIIDIVAACVALELLGVRQVFCSPLPLGCGTVECDHGLMPVPAPAVAKLLEGSAVAHTPPGAVGEMTTPTAAAILRELCGSFTSPPQMTVRAVGYGAGDRRFDGLPNLLRVYLAESTGPAEADSVMELSANIDDATGEVVAATIEALLAAGCLDAWASPATMKKGRPAFVLSALCEPAREKQIAEIFFRQTTTFGLRSRLTRRHILPRRIDTVETPFGCVRVKVGLLDGRAVTASPEFADCLDAAIAHHTAVREVIQAARAAWDAREIS